MAATEMRPKEITEYLTSIVSYQGNLSLKKRPPAVFISGPPGIGKSSIVKQVAEKAGIECIDMRLALKDPTDLRGIPVPENGKAKWLPPSELPTDGRGILFLDEINRAPTLVQSSAFQLVLDRKLGDYVLPVGWTIIAAGNKAEHGAHIYKMDPALRNRFVHVYFELHRDDWTEWALRNDIISEVVEFINFRPDLLFQFDPKRNDDAFPTPRSWEFVSSILAGKNGLSDEVCHKVIQGTVGVGAATEFKEYMKIKDSLPSVDDILDGKNVEAPEKTDIACALATALVVRARPEQFIKALEYSKKFPDEVAVFLGKLLLMKNREALLEAPFFKEWAKKHWDAIKE